MTSESRKEDAENVGAEDSKRGAATMNNAPMAPRAVNLSYELATLQDALGLARIVGDGLRSGSFDDDDEAIRALSGLSSLLSLVGCRMKDLGRVAAGFEDPRVLLAPHNEALEVEGELDDGAVQLAVWPAKRRRRWLRAELHRVGGQIAVSQPARKRRSTA
jgi:hypothetical protein